MRRLLIGIALIGTLSSAGCVPGYYARTNLIGALWTAAVLGAAIHIATHDTHYHWENCGHYRQWHDGRWVYWYNDHWEYYDEVSGRWFVYQ
jgi:hypothetical protein